MNYYGAKNLADSWRTVRNNTIQIAEDIPADQYNFRAAPDTMSVSEMLAHLATSPFYSVQAHFADKKNVLTGADFGGYFAESGKMAASLTSKEAIVDALRSRGDELATYLDGANDSLLAETVELPGGSKSRFEMLLGVKEHEMHHRGQLMLIQRLLGIVPHLTRARIARMAAPATANA